MGVETTPLLMPLLVDATTKTDTVPTTVIPHERHLAWHKAQHIVVPLVLAIVPDTILGLLVQYSRDDPGARILTAFTFASIVNSQVVATLQLVLQTSLDARRPQLEDPLKRRELWVLTQAVWIVYMSYLPFAGLVCGYTAWLARDAIFGQNADVTDVVASLLVISLIALPFSLGSAMLRTELENQNALRPYVVASVVSWSVGLGFAYALGYWTPLGFVGIAITDVLTYSIQFRLLAPATQLLTEWPGWHIREALTLVPRIACHPAMVGLLIVNLVMMLFGYTSLLASLIKVDAWIQDTQKNNVFSSLLMLSFLPLLGVCLVCSMKIKRMLALAYGGDTHFVVRPIVIAIVITVLTAFASVCWIVGALDQGAASLPPNLVAVLKMALEVLVPAFPALGFVLTIRPVLRTCVSLWQHTSTVFVVVMAIGTALGATFAENLDGGIQGLWYGQYLAIVTFIIIAAMLMRRWTAPPSNSPKETVSEEIAFAC